MNFQKKKHSEAGEMDWGWEWSLQPQKTGVSFLAPENPTTVQLQLQGIPQQPSSGLIGHLHALTHPPTHTHRHTKNDFLKRCIILFYSENHLSDWKTLVMLGEIQWVLCPWLTSKIHRWARQWQKKFVSSRQSYRVHACTCVCMGTDVRDLTRTGGYTRVYMHAHMWAWEHMYVFVGDGAQSEAEG